MCNVIRIDSNCTKDGARPIFSSPRFAVSPGRSCCISRYRGVIFVSRPVSTEMHRGRYAVLSLVNVLFLGEPHRPRRHRRRHREINQLALHFGDSATNSARVTEMLSKRRRNTRAPLRRGLWYLFERPVYQRVSSPSARRNKSKNERRNPEDGRKRV